MYAPWYDLLVLPVFVVTAHVKVHHHITFLFVVAHRILEVRKICNVEGYLGI